MNCFRPRHGSFEVESVRRLARALLEVATTTVVIAAGATFTLVNEAVAKVGKRVRDLAA